MSTLVFTSVVRQSSRFWRPAVRTIPIHYLSSQTSRTSGGIFERIPREELVPKIRSRLRNRQLLPGVTGGGFPEFLAEPRDSFPLGVRVNNLNQSSLRELTAKCMEYVEENLPHSHAILFRGLPAKTAEDFSTFAHAMQKQPMTFAGGSGYRSFVDKNAVIYTASDEPKDFTIELHHEMAYNDVFPSKLFFYCLEEPADGCGGETPLAKSNDIFSKLDPEVVRKLEEKGVKYVRCFIDKSNGGYKTWQHQFATDNREEAESRARQQGHAVKWADSGDMYLSHSKSVFTTHPLTGEKIWFAQIYDVHCSYSKALPRFIGSQLPDDKYPCNCYYGDGSDIETEVLQHLRATSWSCAVGFQWRKGDLLVVDNLAVLHGRIGFTGDRKILVHLTAD